MKIIQAIFGVLVMLLLAFGKFSVEITCFFASVWVFLLNWEIIKQWRIKKDIKKFVKDMLFVVLFCLSVIIIIVYKKR